MKQYLKLLPVLFGAFFAVAGIAYAACVTDNQIRNCGSAAPTFTANVPINITSSGGALVVAGSVTYCGTACSGGFPGTGGGVVSNTCGATFSQVANAHDSGVQTAQYISCAPSSTAGACQVNFCSDTGNCTAFVEILAATVYDVPAGTCTVDGSFAGANSNSSTSPISTSNTTSTNTTFGDELFIALAGWNGAANTFTFTGSLLNTFGFPTLDATGTYLGSTKGSGAEEGHQYITQSNTYNASQAFTTAASGSWSGAAVLLKLTTAVTVPVGGNGCSQHSPNNDTASGPACGNHWYDWFRL